MTSVTNVLPERLHGDGRFPFGAPNGPRPVRPASSGNTRQIVIGTYPSALHVGWRPPAYVTMPDGSSGRVASLAIDVEPTVFWDGTEADRLVAEWSARVGFVEGNEPGAHGILTTATNGPSGSGLTEKYFPALPFTVEDTAFLDVYPVYFVKTGTSSQRGQAEAIEQEYNSIVTQLSDASGDRPRFDAATLPLRPTPAAAAGTGCGAVRDLAHRRRRGPRARSHRHPGRGGLGDLGPSSPHPGRRRRVTLAYARPGIREPRRAGDRGHSDRVDSPGTSGCRSSVEHGAAQLGICPRGVARRELPAAD